MCKCSPDAANGMDAARSILTAMVPTESYVVAITLPTLVSATRWNPPGALLRAVMSGMCPGLHGTGPPCLRGSTTRLCFPKVYSSGLFPYLV